MLATPKQAVTLRKPSKQFELCSNSFTSTRSLSFNVRMLTSFAKRGTEAYVKHIQLVCLYSLKYLLGAQTKLELTLQKPNPRAMASARGVELGFYISSTLSNEALCFVHNVGV